MAEDSGQRSNLKDFLASIATIKGDLSNITAPPFVLADKSTTEFPRYWIEHPQSFVAAASEKDPERRMLAVLKWFLSSLKAQQYAGRDPSEGTKKPLNAFLGEVFLGECGPPDDVTKLIAEQVSHHPPVTACYLSNDKHGVRAEGYTRQEVTFSGSVNVKQIGHAVLHIEEFGEDYLIPLPNIKVSGILTGSPYPELQGSYAIVSSSGYIATIDFSGKSLLGLKGSKNHFEASVHRAGSERDGAIFTAEGSWSESFEMKDGTGKVFDTYDVTAAQPTEFRTLPLEQQDAWESRKAWDGVITSLRSGNMQGVADHKAALENAQRDLRKRPDTSEDNWKPLFFRRDHSVETSTEKLLSQAGQSLNADATCGVWKFMGNEIRRPFRGELKPTG